MVQDATDTTDTTVATDTARLLAAVERKVSGRLAAVLESAGSTVEQWRVLSLLADGRGHAMTEVAEHALLPGPTLTKVVDRMVAANLVHRRVDESDRRRVLALITRRGRNAYRSIARAVAREQADLTAIVGADEATRLRELLVLVESRLT
ncbi:MarR family winged helix-turn-helix transcriptional regulator [Streptomyces sp. NPDC000880]